MKKKILTLFILLFLVTGCEDKNINPGNTSTTPKNTESTSSAEVQKKGKHYKEPAELPSLEDKRIK